MIRKAKKDGQFPAIRGNAAEDIKRRHYPNGTACLVLNDSLLSPSIQRMRDLFIESFANEGYRLDVLYSGSISRSLEETYDDLPYPFFLYYDKDILFAHLLEAKKKRLYNKAWSIANCDSKSLTQMMLEEAKLPTIPTIASPLLFQGEYGIDPQFLLSAIERFGFPIIIKEDIGSLGQQVHLASNKEEANRILSSVGGRRVLIQPYLSYKKGTDLRVYVVGGKVVGAMERHNPNDFRSNIENGGSARPVNPSKKAANLAKKAAKALDLEFAGIDLLYVDDDEYRICEVNSNPHFIGLLEATGINLADAIAKHLHKLHRKSNR